MIDILNNWIQVECPDCRFSNFVRLSDVSLNRRTICSGCHQFIYLVDKEASTCRSNIKVNDALNQLEKELSKLSKEFKISF